MLFATPNRASINAHTKDKHNTLVALAARVRAHQKYLMAHHAYIVDINDGKVSQDKVSHYMQETYNVKLDESVTSILNYAKIIFGIEIKSYKSIDRLMDIFENQHEYTEESIDKAILTFKIFCQLNSAKTEMVDYNWTKQLKNTQFPNLKTKLLDTLGLKYSSYLGNYIDSFVPGQYQGILQVIQFKKRSFDYFSGYYDVTLNWHSYVQPKKEGLLTIIKEMNKRIELQEERATFNIVEKMLTKIDDHSFEDEFNKFMEPRKEKYKKELQNKVAGLIVEVNPATTHGIGLNILFKQVMEVENIKNSHTVKNSITVEPENALEFIQNIINKCYEIYHTLDKCKAYIEKEYRLIKLNEELNRKENNIKTKINTLKKSMDDVKTSDVFTKLQEIPDKVDNQLALIERSVNEMEKQYRYLFSSVDELTEGSINQFYEETCAKEKDVTTAIETLHSELNSIYIEAEERREAKQKKQEEREARRLEEIESERKQYQSEADEKIKNRHEQVAKKRAEAKLNAVNKQKPLPTPNETIKFINEGLENRFLALSSSDFRLLNNIVNKSAGVNYEAALTLIRKLGGSVSEIGNGSSHKCIELDKLIIEVFVADLTPEPITKKDQKKSERTKKKTSTDNNNSQKSVEAGKLTAAVNARNDITATTGTFFQHGGAHIDRGLCPVNLNAFHDLFVNQVGLTNEILQQLEEKSVQLKNRDNPYEKLIL